jgi:hypothetical protein
LTSGDGYDRAFQHKHIKQLWDRGYFVTLFCDCNLAEDHFVVGGTCAYEVDGFFAIDLVV